MNAIVEQINSGGYTFVEFAASMLIQASVLIVLLLLADLALRRRVRAVFRYWMWLLVLVKLVLPTSLSGPFSIGYWFGDKLECADVGRGAYEPQAAEPMMPALPYIDISNVPPAIYPPATSPAPGEVDVGAAQPIVPPSVPPAQIEWQGVVFLLWLAIVTVLVLLLVQRAIFVHGLVTQARGASRPMYDALEECRSNMKVGVKVGLKVSPNAASPAVCGLLHPVILVPQNLAYALDTADLRIVLLHELAHVKRGDLWVNLAQTLLQIIYFYNPLLWLANAVIRRAREQAVDEAMLVAMGERASRYPQTLVSVAKLAFKRPALSLRLIGVVESKSALTARIKRILSRPIPKSAKLGILGLTVIVITAAIVLPMAKAQPYTDRARQVMALAEQEARRLKHEYVGTEHILIALAGQKDGVAAKVLDKLGIQKETVESELAKLVRPGSKPTTKGNLPQTPRAKKALELAEHEAKGLGHDYIGTEHILLGVVREKECLAAQMLAKLGVSYDVARAAVLDFVKPGPGVKTDAEVEVESEQISAAVGVQDSALSRSTSAEAAFVIQKVLDRYASIKTYSAIGELLTVVDRPLEAMGAIPGMTTKMLQQMGERQLKSIFTIKMARPNLYCIEWNQHIDTDLSKVGNAWSVGDGSYGLILGKEKSFEKPLMALIGTAGNMGRVQSSLFFDTSLNTLRELRGLSQQEDEQLEGVECYVISGSRYRRTYTYWVSKKDFLIRRYKFVSGGDGKPVEGGGHELTEETIRHYLKATDREATPEEIAKTRAMLAAANAMASEAKVTNTETYRNIILDQPISKEQFVPSKDIDEITEELKNLRAQYIQRLGNISPTEPNLKTDVQVEVESGKLSTVTDLPNNQEEPQRKTDEVRYEGRTIAEWISRFESESHDEQREAIGALARIGRALVPAIIEEMKKGGIRASCARGVMGEMGPEAEEAVPWLIEVALDKDVPIDNGWESKAAYRECAVCCLNDMPWARDRVVPVLRRIAEDDEDDTRLRRVAVLILRDIGKEAIPILRKLVETEDGEIQNSAHHMLAQVLEREGELSKEDYYTPLIEKDPFGASVPEYLAVMKSPKSPGGLGGLHPVTQKIKKLYRERLATQPDPELAWRLATIIQNGLRNTELMWAAPTGWSTVRWPREDPAENFATLAEVLQLGFDHAESGSQLQRQFGISLAKLRLLQGDWDGMNAMLKELGQEPMPKESRQWLHAPPVDWEEGPGSQWKTADESMRSGNCSLEFRIEKDGKGLKGVHFLVKRAPESTNVINTGISIDTLFFEPYPLKGFSSFGYKAADRPMSRYAVSDESGIVRFEKLPNIPIKIEVLVPTSNFPEGVSNWDLWMEVEPGKYKIAKKYGAGAINTQVPPAVAELKEGQTVHYPNLVVRVEGETADEKAGLVWGEVVKGLRAAIEFEQEKQTYSILEKIDVHFHIQNISDKPIQFISESYRWEPLKIEDANGNRQGVRENVYSGSPPVTRHYLEPGREVVLRGLPLSIAQDEQQLESLGGPYGTDFKAKPGVYFVRSRLTIPGVISSSLPARQDDWTGQLETGRHKLVVAVDPNSGNRPR